ncbi:helix-turn-helix transcriptional regulator [Enterobacterales bacterium CwR94]|nr:helix-turn-helix transcriptional regulator [Enterobacterales bacterium CwR94]
MNNTKSEIITYASDCYAAIGLDRVLDNLDEPVTAHSANTLHDIALMCEKRRPALVIYVFHENMDLNGVLTHLLEQHTRFPDLRSLVITKKLFPLFSGLSRHLMGLKVASLHLPLSELGWIISAELMRMNCDYQMEPCADIMLPDRHLKILQLLAWSMSTDQVAMLLGISGKTANAHKLNALARLHVQSKSDIADLWIVADELRMVINVLRYSRTQYPVPRTEPVPAGNVYAMIS